MVDQVSSPEDCQRLCKERQGCNYFTWVSSHSNVYQNTCWLKSSEGDPRADSSMISGPKTCSNDGCCKQVHLTSSGGTVDYQGNRLGYYEYYGTLNDRPTYKQVRTSGTPNYLYYYEWGWWYSNAVLGENMGGIINHDDAVCPEQISESWDYYQWGDGTANDWVADDTLRVSCEAPQPTPSPSECCSYVRVSSSGGTADYQWTRLGYYEYYGTLNNRPTYKQIGAEKANPNYLYYYDYGWWYAGESYGENSGGIINDDDASCPDQIKETWRYYQWGDGTANDWVEDSSLRVTCESPPSSSYH